MVIQNNTDRDCRLFGIDFAKGELVDVPDNLEQAKKDYLIRNFDVVSETLPPPAPVVDKTEPSDVVALDVSVQTEPEPEAPKPSRKKRRSFKRSRSE